MSEREIQREGRWKSGVYKVHTRNKTEDASEVSRKLANKRNGVSETTRPRYGLGETATVADDLGFGGV